MRRREHERRLWADDSRGAIPGFSGVVARDVERIHVAADADHAAELVAPARRCVDEHAGASFSNVVLSHRGEADAILRVIQPDAIDDVGARLHADG